MWYFLVNKPNVVGVADRQTINIISELYNLLEGGMGKGKIRAG